MDYAIKTPAGALYMVLLAQAPLPGGKTPAEMDLLPVDATIEEGYRQDFSQGPVTARGWQIVEGTVRPFVVAIPPPTLESLRARLAARRWQIEVGGVALGGLAIETDDRSKLLLLGAADTARRNEDFTTRWKTEEGWTDLTAAQIIAAADAVLAHTQACFAREAELSELLIEGADIEAMSAAIELFWPA